MTDTATFRPCGYWAEVKNLITGSCGRRGPLPSRLVEASKAFGNAGVFRLARSVGSLGELTTWGRPSVTN